MILVDSGPSGFGASFYDSFLRCPLKWARENLPHRVDGGSKSTALARGSILHSGLAHHYATYLPDAAEYYEPFEAMEKTASKLGAAGAEVLGKCRACLTAYIARYGRERFKVTAVEKLFETKLADAPYSARVDLEIEDTSGRIFWVDHKSTYKIDSRTATRYTLALQFLGQQYLGQLHYGERFAGIRLNFLGMESPFKFERKTPDPAPWAVAQFPKTVTQAWARMQKMRSVLGDAVEKYPAHFGEQTCVTSYGLCPHLDTCRWGKQ